ncbi:hypothetical protein H0H92_000397 [Tricholoma furcatifolium]|nr:hypothetical protein H0H92_000397 [Tricholoma furcatifolium]
MSTHRREGYINHEFTTKNFHQLLAAPLSRASFSNNRHVQHELGSSIVAVSYKTVWLLVVGDTR